MAEQSIRFIVTKDGKPYDEVFFSNDDTPETVRRSLIDHDGYPIDIQVRKARRKA